MSKETALCGFVLAIAAGLLLALAPGMMSGMFVALMVMVVAAAFMFGIYRVSLFNHAMKVAKYEVIRALDVQAVDNWLVIRQVPELFGFDVLDRMFVHYRADVDSARERKASILPDIEDYLNEEEVALSTWRGVILQMPSVLIGIGILGTFVGLIIGVGGVGFSSVTAAINGVEALLSGIQIAFYTSIAGLIMSILFNLMYRTVWNIMNRNLRRFILEFQSHVIPSSEQQEQQNLENYRSQVISLLVRKPKRSE